MVRDPENGSNASRPLGGVEVVRNECPQLEVAEESVLEIDDESLYSYPRLPGVVDERMAETEASSFV